MRKTYTTFSAFSIIEVMIGIFVFSLGLVSIYMLLVSALSVNEYNKNAIIASNLAREQMEIYRNIRDTNYLKFKKWDQMNPGESYTPTTQVFEIGKYYTIENDFLSPWFPADVQEITSHSEWVANLSAMGSYRLCLNGDTEYTYDCSPWNTPTVFYRYLSVEQALDDGWNPIMDAYMITSKVIWYKRGYHEYDIKTIVADWRRI